MIMAVVMMGGADGEKPMFHDFLGMSCGGDPPAQRPPKSGEKMVAVEAQAEASAASSGGHGLISGSSDLGSERQGANNSEVFHFHGRKNAVSGSGPEASITFSGRKRSNSDSAYMGLIRDRMLPGGPESPESSRRMKMIGKEVVGERPGRSHDDEMMFSMQLLQRPNSSLILHPPVSSRPDSLVSRWERTTPLNPGPMVHFPSRFGQSGTYMDKLASPHTYRDASAGGALFSQAAADEGSRTGIKGSGIMNIANPSNAAAEKNSTVVLPSSSRPRVPQTTEPESSRVPSRHSVASTSRQMTIFYAGQAHVFDDVHPNKADVIMALAGSNGGSWSTTYSPKKPDVCPQVNEAKVPNREIDMPTNTLPLAIQRNLDCGHRQVARIPVITDFPNLISGGHQGGRAVGDAKPRIPAAEPDKEGRKNV